MGNISRELGIRMLLMFLKVFLTNNYVKKNKVCFYNGVGCCNNTDIVCVYICIDFYRFKKR